MRRPSPSFVIPAGVSLALHAVLLVVLPRYATEVSRVDATLPDDSAAISEPDPVLEPKIPPPEEEPLPEFIIGDATGKGFASHEIPDELEAAAREADADQAFLSLDPPGAGGTGDDGAVTHATGEGARPGQPGGSPPPVPFGLTEDLKLPRVARKHLAENLIAMETAPASPADGSDVVAEAPGGPPIPPAATLELPARQIALAPAVRPTDPGSAVAGGSQQPAADPARMSDSESDPFSKLGTVIFREGSLDIRFGRKVKTRRPKLLLAARSWDAIVIRKPDVGLRIDVDATGKVTSVAVIKSSGSNEIDQPTRVAVYDWWFEPKTDVDGKPVGEQYRFVIGYR